MKKSVFLLVGALIAAGNIIAQDRSMLYDKTVLQLLECVQMLKDNPSAHEKVKTILMENASWTLMNEIDDSFSPSTARCRLKDKVDYININSLGNAIERQRLSSMKSASSFLNGNSPNYNHSIYELMIKSNTESSFTLNCRLGPQLFVVVPYDRNNALNVSILYKGDKVKCNITGQGYMEYIINNVDDQASPITVEISNNSDLNLSAVIINHNMSNRRDEN